MSNAALTIASLDSDKVILLMIRNILAQSVQPGLSAAERQFLLESLKELRGMLKDWQEYDRIKKAYETIDKAQDWMDKQNGFLQMASVELLLYKDGSPAGFAQNNGMDWKALLAAGVAIAPFMMAAPALLPVLAAIEGIDAVLIGGVAAANLLL